MTPLTRTRCRALLTMLIACAQAASAAAQPSRPAYATKLTVGLYHTPAGVASDLNVRHAFDRPGPGRALTGWAGVYTGPDGFTQPRLGVEYDLRRPALLVVPSLQVASHAFVGGSVYGEIGTRVYAIAGLSRTNLAPYANLTFDPNESWQLGGGVRAADETLALFTIRDNRLGTGQQITHLVIRHESTRIERLSLDLSWKAGRDGAGVERRGAGGAVEYDVSRWFAKAAVERHANFDVGTMVRVGGGVRF